jgi:transcriptional regulator with XRE-family HTH domain
MRPSPLRHNLARLRLDLGLGQKEMAELAGCSSATIQSIELGRLSLSEELARKISAETGILFEWLLLNDLRMPLIADHGEPFAMEDFNRRRSEREMGIPTTRALLRQGLLGEGDALIYFAWMRGIFAANKADIATWKVGKFLEQLARDYGYHHDVLPVRKVSLASIEGRLDRSRFKSAGGWRKNLREDIALPTPGRSSSGFGDASRPSKRAGGQRRRGNRPS